MSREDFFRWLKNDTEWDINFLTAREKAIALEAWQACAEEKDKRIAELAAQNKELVEENKKLKDELEFYSDPYNSSED